jgi:hypothetical protein
MSDRSFEGGGFGNNVKLYKPWSMADGDEESRCLQHHLLFLIYDFGDILSHPQFKYIQSISHKYEVYLASVPFISNI